MTRTEFSWILAATCAIGVACGGRTDDYGGPGLGGPLGTGEDSSVGGNPNPGGRGGGGGSPAAGGVSYGGYAGSYGGTSYGGYAGSYGGGVFGGCGADCNYGGYAGGVMDCAYPNCQSCGDCLTQCSCFGGDLSLCYNECYGAGGQTQAAGGTAGCVPSYCPTSSAGAPIVLQGCCTQYGACGIDTTALSGFLDVPIGCQDRDEPGFPDNACPSMPTPLNTTLAGCCRSDGLCGNDLGALGLGCVTNLSPGGIRFCGGDSSGGFGGSAAGGYYGGYGGVNSIGGYGGTFIDGGVAGGGAGGGSAAAECVSQARSDCERCACTSCGDDMLSCFRDAGCPQILKCANQTGCTGFDCYEPNTCEKVIDQYGGPGFISTTLAQPLFQCLQAAGCGCGFKESTN